MKNLFGDNRQANILSVLRKNSALNIEMLAQRFGVSERTVRNDIKDINRELKNSGLVEINQVNAVSGYLIPEIFRMHMPVLLRQMI